MVCEDGVTVIMIPASGKRLMAIGEAVLFVGCGIAVLIVGVWFALWFSLL
jgi:hypothetical protein